MGRRKIVIILMAALAVFVAPKVWRNARSYVFAERFAVVEPGKLYRGAWQKTWPMRRLVRDYKIKTIVALAHPPDDPMCIREQALAREMGCRWVHIPIADDRTNAQGPRVNDRLEQAARTLADPANYPLYFHCHHGINRASMAQIAYRTLYCGWSLDQATAEIARKFGLKEVSRGPDYRRMALFYAERVLPRRQARVAAETTVRK
jgi:hypothetical protein